MDMLDNAMLRKLVKALFILFTPIVFFLLGMVVSRDRVYQLENLDYDDRYGIILTALQKNNSAMLRQKYRIEKFCNHDPDHIILSSRDYYRIETIADMATADLLTLWAGVLAYQNYPKIDLLRVIGLTKRTTADNVIVKTIDFDRVNASKKPIVKLSNISVCLLIANKDGRP